MPGVKTWAAENGSMRAYHCSPHPITISLADDEQTLPGIDLPCFASFTQLKDEEGWNRLKTYFKKFAQVGLK